MFFIVFKIAYITIYSGESIKRIIGIAFFSGFSL